MEKTQRLYAFVKPWYTILLRLAYHPKWIGKENIPEERTNSHCSQS